jgi:hypothetical protein
VGFVNIYGPGAPRVKGYSERELFTFLCSALLLTIRLGWYGAVGSLGTIVGFLCGTALLLLLWAVSSVLFDRSG